MGLEYSRVKVLIVDDSMLMRVLIKDILSEDKQLHVVGTANNGQDAYLKTEQLQPDVVLMDLVMGEYSGIYGIEKIMQRCPTPILVLSAVGNSNMDQIMQALNLGAVDYLNKPARHNMDLRSVGESLKEKVHAAKAASVKSKLGKQKNVHRHSFNSELPYDVIVIGASTGGPSALEEIILNLPANLPVPVLIVQHMPDHFLPSFAARLNRMTPLSLSVAKEGELVEKGKILLMPAFTNCDLRVNSEDCVEVCYSNKRFQAYNNPSVDALFIATARIYKERTIGVILTGMGKDGTEGIDAIYKAGGYAIAQSEDSCVVYGMPKSAIEQQLINQIVKLKDIGGFLVSCLA